MAEHFSAVAEHYRELRDLDDRTARSVVQMIAELAERGDTVRVVDVGAGTGRYTEAVIDIAAADHGVVCHGVAYDANEMMLGSSGVLADRAEGGFNHLAGLAETLPFRDGALDAVLCFNAIHHFSLDEFLREAGRVLGRDGLLIVYTRTPEQNQRTVWGQLFPMFAERETRLYTEDDLRCSLMRRPELREVHLSCAPWTVKTTIARLIEQARGRHYSTFRFYSQWEFVEALKTFEKRLAAASADGSAISMQNDHLLISARRG